jgi:hypothetical protein
MLYFIYLLALSSFYIALIFKLLQRGSLRDETRIRFVIAVLIALHRPISRLPYF